MVTPTPAKRKPGRPPRTIPGHMVRVRMDLSLWEAFEATARAQGTTASEVVRQAAEEYVKRHRRGKPR